MRVVQRAASDDRAARIEEALERALAPMTDGRCPPCLWGAVRHAVFPGGARVRPTLCLGVAEACGADAPEVVEAAAAAVELVHCASLVHDDLPCFDDAPLRRGRPSVHHAFGEPLAVLTGDELVARAFDALARGTEERPMRTAPLVRALARAVCAPDGIVAGQAWESEPAVGLADYHRTKTASLFEAAAVMGAMAAGAPGEGWAEVGARLGLAYQLADDLLDEGGDRQAIGKPAGRDAALGRPNARHQLGARECRSALEDLIEAAVQAVPPCTGREALRAWVRERVGGLLVARGVPARGSDELRGETGT